MARNRKAAAAKTTTAKPATSKRSSSLEKAFVLFDRYRWLDDNDAVQSASKGDTIEVSADEFKRGKDLGALAKPGKDAEQAQEPAEPELTTPGGEPVDGDGTEAPKE